jgi:hypothetical protein
VKLDNLLAKYELNRRRRADMPGKQRSGIVADDVTIPKVVGNMHSTPLSTALRQSLMLTFSLWVSRRYERAIHGSAAMGINRKPRRLTRLAYVHANPGEDFRPQDAVRVASGQHADMPQRNAGIGLVVQ